VSKRGFERRRRREGKGWRTSLRTSTPLRISPDRGVRGTGAASEAGRTERVRARVAARASMLVDWLLLFG
jgi:hypothetical protein